MPTAGKLDEILRKHNLSDSDLAEYLNGKGWGVEHPSMFRIDLEENFLAIWEKAAPFTMISMERGYAVYQAVNYILRNNLPGDFVECGVWKGGSCMLMALTLLESGVTDKPIWLYDTFKGMTEPCEKDRIASTGQAVSERWEEGWWAVSPGMVEANLKKTGYPMEHFHMVEGDVCETLKSTRPKAVSLLRLDTDWYESTRFELEILYPLLKEKGVLIIDDYGHFSGSRQAVDEYFTGKLLPLLQRSDYTGRLALKPVPSN